MKTLPVLLYMPGSRVVVPILKYAIPLMRKARLEWLLLVTDHAVMAIAGYHLSRLYLDAVEWYYHCSKADLRRALTTELYRTVDSRGLELRTVS